MEGAAGHPTAAHFQPVVLGGLPYRDSRLDAFKKIHASSSFIFVQVSPVTSMYGEKGPDSKNPSVLQESKKPPPKLAELQDWKRDVHKI